MLRLTLEEKSWPLIRPFTISRGSRNAARTIIVTLTDEAGDRGRGEAVPYARYGETIPAALAQLRAAKETIEAGLTHKDIPALLTMKAARNALDCALWDLRAKQSGQPVWKLAGLNRPKPLVTAYTISLDTPENMASQARQNAARPLLKLKLGARTAISADLRDTPSQPPDSSFPRKRESRAHTGNPGRSRDRALDPRLRGDDVGNSSHPLSDTARDDIARLEAVRAAAPDARLVIDANEGWKPQDLPALFAACARCDVELIEQPLPAGKDEALAGLARPVPLCADESAHDVAGLARLEPLYDAINIKLDKTGGLTEALKLASEARARGFEIMTGCMLASSLAMAPAFLVAQMARWTDLDGPLLLAEDAQPAMTETDGLLNPPAPALWG